MLYKLTENLDQLEPLESAGIAELSGKEKDLENLIASNLLSTLFEATPFLPFHQSRNYQNEADIYALNDQGDVVLFELKRGIAGAGALEQLLRYTQEAGNWTYEDIDAKYQAYPDDTLPFEELDKAHQQSFGLSLPLRKEAFNHRQFMIVVGNAADDSLIKAIDYWKLRGVNIDFVPYRIYKLGGTGYFEFFAKPYDQRLAWGARKGVIFDTNRSYDEESIWEMIGECRIAAYGDAKDQVRRLTKGDIAFMYHKGEGIVAAAELTGNTIGSVPAKEELFQTVRFLTSTPVKGKGFKAVTVEEIRKATGKNFFWARTAKVPYLSYEEALKLLEFVKAKLQV